MKKLILSVTFVFLGFSPLSYAGSEYCNSTLENILGNSELMGISVSGKVILQELLDDKYIVEAGVPHVKKSLESFKSVEVELNKTLESEKENFKANCLK